MFDSATAVDRVLAQLQRQRPKGGGGWSARCPAHEDTNNSLSIDVRDGKVLLKCFAGCEVDRIVDAMGLKVSDLFDGEAPSITQAKTQPRRIVKTYDYVDEHAQLLYQAVRYEPKYFQQRRPDGKGGWSWNLQGVRRVVYRLNELQRKKAVFLVEGEKDADALWKLGLPATTNVCGGAVKWSGTEFAQQLVAAGVERVRVLPDNDVTGRGHADSVARSCVAAGLDTRIVSLPGVPLGGDVSDYLQTHTREDLLALAKAAPVYEAAALTSAAPTAAGGLELTALGDLLSEPDETVRWVVNDRIPSGSVVMLAGKPKAGKSTLARDLAFAVATGQPWLGWPTSPGRVWYVALEEKRSELRKTFRAMGATSTEPISLFIGRAPDDLLAQMYAAAKDQQPVLIIVDTLQRLIRCRDMNDYAEVTTKFDSLIYLARETGAAVLLLHHASKAARAGIDAVLGSTSLTGSVDNVLVLSRADQVRTLTTIQRIGDDVDETILVLDKSTQRVTLGVTRHEAEHAAVAAAILGALRAGVELTERDLSGHVEGRTEIKRAALRKLVAEGTIHRNGAGKRSDPYRYRVDATPPPVVGVARELAEPIEAFTRDGFVEV